ncbi:DNA polymerase III subunit chi [Aliiglaciecola sp. LCG003]|uniref:DNA polymerase III subunit chi n=1 Tax=Aliiglaciecola sp. LCG003 TaxID=3053655 RepID=UPI0025741CA3|nr:DNA polymerase III subunit chi [Aliiglaciecola sp. LCG003]WJG10080.1 DNA polymerase III subunit chi [Aliiglaciecola sp. LCG003]
MTDVTFYMLEEPDAQHPAHWLIACEIAAQCFRTKRRCLVLCDDQAGAEAFDELLWQQPLDGFVPHNLTGEGPKGGAPVEICWQQPLPAGRPVLINLSKSLPQNANRFKQILDFVPAEDTAKQQARDRYKHYRAAGLTMHTQPASNIYEKQDG